ncbi:hypothetical protein BJ085DRAFT_37153 [Dimargaris cristalligena]|uniref:Histone deacetylase complex subunit SAP30 Sin3 binding domain-containing protein n=1 Tax=Dimargaris cristalligena TaxID=215637 RepID=A0A4P9ZR95_9FUNG|nr:hypothetical protein BJ085DRAFT_37153 [Dimargaris cristalligena]|eukprot:RKP35865.1 hypothetical protein BJ085DRAFT_37153 [Dimargaris cristalligena]
MGPRPKQAPTLTQSANGAKRTSSNDSSHRSSTAVPSGPVKLDFNTMNIHTLRKYRQVHRLNTKNRASKEELVTGSLPPLFIVELQGSLQSEVASLAGENVGDLTLDPEFKPGSIARLTVGQHRLQGKIEKLAKPLAYVEANPSSNDGSNTTYTINQIIYYKVIFKERPHLIVGSS